MIVLITGPVRAGKSSFAERLARERGKDVVYVATAQLDPGDPEWSARIEHHRARRPAEWALIETGSTTGVDLAGAIAQADARACLLVDSLGTWLADVLADTDDDRVQAHVEQLWAALESAGADVIVVGEETGWGIVPEYLSARRFRDHLGRLQARLAQRADRAYLVVSGYAIDLKAVGTPI